MRIIQRAVDIEILSVYVDNEFLSMLTANKCCVSFFSPSACSRKLHLPCETLQIIARLIKLYRVKKYHLYLRYSCKNTLKRGRSTVQWSSGEPSEGFLTYDVDRQSLRSGT